MTPRGSRRIAFPSGSLTGISAASLRNASTFFAKHRSVRIEANVAAEIDGWFRSRESRRIPATQADNESSSWPSNADNKLSSGCRRPTAVAIHLGADRKGPGDTCERGDLLVPRMNTHDTQRDPCAAGPLNRPFDWVAPEPPSGIRSCTEAHSRGRFS